MVQLVGILNITPDSFSDGDLYLDPERAVKHAEQLFADGASLVDIGAESTRPGATPISYEVEWLRLKDVIKWFSTLYPGKLSLDTYHPETAKLALSIRDFIINDVTGNGNPAMVDVIVERQARCVIGHLPGPANTDIQAIHSGKQIDNIQQVIDELLSKAGKLEDKGLKRKNIILDPGIGYGKTHELNWQLLKFARHVPGYRVMIGYSRKRFLGDKRMELKPNLAAGRIAIEAGAMYLRVHDVAGHRQLLKDLKQ
ncbi:MAG TPA: dihydropteroate synthase [Candidatus Saccharimonadales bacterium]|nr:dihydropteroate synthase [Candidatus Saccharimonadales bacterium]